MKSEPEFLNFKEPKNRFQGINYASLCSLAGRYDNPIPTRFLAPVDCLKIPALLLELLAPWIPDESSRWGNLYDCLDCLFQTERGDTLLGGIKQ
jgi:hypothetical protein